MWRKEKEKGRRREKSRIFISILEGGDPAKDEVACNNNM